MNKKRNMSVPVTEMKINRVGGRRKTLLATRVAAFVCCKKKLAS